MCSVDVTRVEQWIPLRENFALPFLWSQLAVLTFYFRPSLSATLEVCISFFVAVTVALNAFSFFADSS